MMEMAKKQYGRHREGLEPMTVWVESGFKEQLKQEAKAAGLPHWSLSDQIRYELQERRGMWKESYRPAQVTPGRKKTAAA